MSQNSAHRESLVEAALQLAARGWPVFPCSPQTKAPLLPNDMDAQGKKIPKTGGSKKASTNAAQIRSWWLKWPDALIGVATGFGRLFVVDFDPRTDEATGEVFTLDRLKADLEAQMGCALPASLISITQSGGVHVWLQWPDDGGPAITNRGNLPLHVDVRGEGGYVIAPPSVMTSGRDYHWLRRDGETLDPARAVIAEAPAELVRILRDKAPAKKKAASAGQSDAPAERAPLKPISDDPVEAARRKWALAGLDNSCAELARARQGERGQELNRIGFYLGTLVGAGVLSAAMAIAGLVDASQRNGLTGTDGLDLVQANAERAVRDGEGHPRDMSDVGTQAGRSSHYPPADREPPRANRRTLGPPPPSPRRAAATAETLPDGSIALKDLPVPEQARLIALGNDWLVRRRYAIRDGLDAEALRKLAYNLGRRVAPGVISVTAETRSIALGLGGMIALDPLAAKSFKNGLRKPFDLEPMRVLLRGAGRPMTDMGNAERFMDRHGKNFRFTTAKGWLGWDGRRWAVLDQDKDNDPAEVRAAVFETVRAIQDESRAVATTGHPGKVKHGLDHYVPKGRVFESYSVALAEWGRTSESAGKLGCIANLAKRWLTVPIEQFDCDPFAVNVLNGTLRFTRERREDGKWGSTVRLEAHCRDHLNTKLAPVTYDPDAISPVYDEFFVWAQPDAGMRRYLHQWAGYSLSGSTSEQKLQFWYGLGANGKSTAIDIWAYVAGDYSGTIGIETFLDQGIKKRGEQASPDLARLGGVRMLRASEPERGAKLNEALIKAATGGEPMAVRALHRGFFDLRPLFKLTIGGNYRPDIPGTDEGIWRRMKLIPWEQHRAENERDEALPDKLKAEADGIFNRIVAGMLDWLANGLVEPKAVTDATAQYREDSDPLARFLGTCVVDDPQGRVQSSHLYEVFVAWTTAAGETEWKQKGFTKAMLDKGFKKKASNGIQWLGIKLIKDVRDFVDAEGRPLRIDDDGDAGATLPPDADERPPPDFDYGLDDDTPPF